MKGSIRIVVGFLLVLGVVGTLDVDVDVDLGVQLFLAVLGLAIAYSGGVAMESAK